MLGPMTAPADPWRTLGLTPGSSPDEVRRAYRRLAKANHPDAAGEAALPRFLAIQAAYEQIAGSRTRRRPGARPAGGSAGADDRPREAWRADPERARATGRADRRRPGSRPASGPAGSSGWAGSSGPAASPGSAGSRGPSGPARSGARSTGGAATDGASSGRDRDREGPGADRASGRSGKGGPSSSQEPRSRRGGRTRSAKKATPYSTSYDAADDEPFEPGWSGATWYGASSGTYWTINPKEYADPRKHGPEYQRRARRSRGGWILDDEAPGEPVVDGDATDGDATASGGSSAEEPPPAARSSRSWTDARGHAGAASGPPPAPPSGLADAGLDAVGPSPIQRLPRVRPPTTLPGRLIAAILAWPLLGAALALAVQESSGCGRFAASCPELSAPGTWLLLVATLVLLMALPRVAAWLVTGTLAAFAAGAAMAVALSAGGGTALPDVSTSILGSTVVAAYIVGVVYAIVLDRLSREPRRVP
jgi:curved DNA-binding protein CbpA